MKIIELDLEINGNNFKLNQVDITKLFHHVYYGSQVWMDTNWMGYPILKCPLDMWIYQEIIWEMKPDFIIETGTFHGGSALYYANLFDIIGNGKVITIDIEKRNPAPNHPRIEYVIASSTDINIFNQIKEITNNSKSTMVVLDSDHSMDHVYKEMSLWNELVTVGNYLIVEDSNVNGHPVRDDFGPGPMEAINKFLVSTNQFEIDYEREKFFMTQNPKGYLKKKFSK
jgi:cephalosporin hydroxylase